MRNQTPQDPRDAEQAERLAHLAELRTRLADFLESDPEGTAIALKDLALATVAGCYPEILTPEVKAKIKDNYPGATEALMTERSMSKKGLLLNTTLATQFMQIALDYSPLAHCAPDIAADKRLPPMVGEQLGRDVTGLVDRGIAAGMSPFGVAATLILSVTMAVKQNGLPWPKLVRPLMDAINLAVAPMPSFTPAQEEAMLRNVMGLLGISRATAKRYMATVKQRYDME